MEYKLSVTGVELQVIGKALGSMPFVQVADIIAKLKSQAEAGSAPPIESRWEHVARNMLPPDEFERLSVAVARYGQP